MVYDIYDMLTGDELEEVTNIMLEALARVKGVTPEVFEPVIQLEVE